MFSEAYNPKRLIYDGQNTVLSLFLVLKASLERVFAEQRKLAFRLSVVLQRLLGGLSASALGLRRDFKILGVLLSSQESSAPKPQPCPKIPPQNSEAPKPPNLPPPPPRPPTWTKAHGGGGLGVRATLCHESAALAASTKFARFSVHSWRAGFGVGFRV